MRSLEKEEIDVCVVQLNVYIDKAHSNSWMKFKLGKAELEWSESRWVMSDALRPLGLYSPWNSPGQNTGLQGIFPTQGLNPGLPHWGQILHQLSHKGSPRILEWVAYPFSRSSRPRNQTRISCIADGFFTNWAIREAPFKYSWFYRLPKWLSSKESSCQYRRHKRFGFGPWVGKIPWNRKWQPTQSAWEIP